MITEFLFVRTWGMKLVANREIFVPVTPKSYIIFWPLPPHNNKKRKQKIKDACRVKRRAVVTH